MPNPAGAIARDGVWDALRLGSAVLLTRWADDFKIYKNIAGATSDLVAFSISLVVSLLLVVIIFNLILARAGFDMIWSDSETRFTLTSLNLTKGEARIVEFKAACTRPSALSWLIFLILRLTGGGVLVTFSGATRLTVTPEDGSDAVVDYRSKALFVSARGLAFDDFNAWADVRFLVHATAEGALSDVRGALALRPGSSLPFSGLFLRPSSSMKTIESRR